MKELLLFSIFSIFCLTISAQDWTQMGTDINGVNNGDHSGVSVSMSNDGLTIATGSFSNHDYDTTTGHVRVFTFTENEWILKGDPITGLSGENGVGSFVSLSGDGNRIAICISSISNISPPAGKIRVYDWNGTSWEQVGNDLLWNGGSAWAGSAALSNNGQVLAVGDYSYSINEVYLGQVRVYTLNGNTWQQRGASIEGTPDGFTGSALSISNDGSVFATNLQDKIQVYQWNGTDYVPKGNILNPFSLRNVTINGNGNWVAVSGENIIGETDNKGATQVYKWNGSAWQPIGIPIQGVPESRFGHALSFNEDGQVLAISSIYNFQTNSGGKVRVFLNSGANWEQTGNTIMGTLAIGYFGNSISLNATGNIIGIGEPGYLSSNYGLVDKTQVFRNDEVLSVEEINLLEIGIYPNPSNGHFTIDLGREYTDVEIEISNIVGQVVSTKKYASAKRMKQKIQGSAGIYFMKVSSNENVIQTLKVIKK